MKQRPLWRRLGGLSGMTAVGIYRFGCWTRSIHVPVLRRLLYGAYRFLDNIVVRFLLGADFPAGCHIGNGLALPHGANGIVLNKGCQIGENVTVYHQVTIGVMSEGELAPSIGNDVLIGVGAKILGPIHIGNNARIGANAVVITDVPDNATAVGVPARIIYQDKT